MPPLKPNPDPERLARLNARLNRMHKINGVLKDLRKARKQAEALLRRSPDNKKR